MSQLREMIEAMKQGDETVKEGIQAAAPGLTLNNVLHDVGQELKQQAAHGAHELSAALFNGSAFVMYPRQGQGKDQVDDPQHGPSQEGQKEQEAQKQQERGGMSM